MGKRRVLRDGEGVPVGQDQLALCEVLVCEVVEVIQGQLRVGARPRLEAE